MVEKYLSTKWDAAASALRGEDEALVAGGIATDELSKALARGGLMRRPTATQLVLSAIDQLNGASPAAVKEAIYAIKSQSLAGDGILDYLERKVRVGEVLNKPAKDWVAPTPSDFAVSFQMENGRLDIMDIIVSIAKLNARDLEEEI